MSGLPQGDICDKGYKTMTQNGKGSKRRPEDVKKFKREYDCIFKDAFVPKWKRDLMKLQEKNDG